MKSLSQVSPYQQLLAQRSVEAQLLWLYRLEVAGASYTGTGESSPVHLHSLSVVVS